MSHEVVNVYVIKDKRLKKLGFRLDDAKTLIRMGEEAFANEQGIQADLTMLDGSVQTLTHEHGEIYDAESITVPAGVKPIENLN